MFHVLVPLTLLIVTVLNAQYHFCTSVSYRVEISSAISAPLPTVLFALIWGGLIPFFLVCSPIRSRSATPIPALLFGAYALFALVSMIASGIEKEGIIRFSNWISFPVICHFLGRRHPISERATLWWMHCLGAMAFLHITSSLNMVTTPANPNLTAMLFIPGLVMSVYFCLVRGSFKTSWIGVLIVVVFILCGRRTAVVSAVFGAGLILFDTRRGKQTGKLALSFITFLFAVGIVNMLQPGTLGESFVDRLGNLPAIYQGGETVEFDIRRATLTDMAVETFLAYPVSGVGFGRYLAYLEGQSVDPRLIAQPHNFLLLALAETGVPGAILLVMALLVPGLLGWHRSKPASFERYWVISYLSLCVYLLGGDYIHSPGFWPVYLAMSSACLYVPFVRLKAQHASRAVGELCTLPGTALDRRCG